MSTLASDMESLKARPKPPGWLATMGTLPSI